VIGIARKHEHTRVGEVLGVPLDRFNRLQAALGRRHDQGRCGDPRQAGIKLHVDARGGRAERRRLRGLAHELVGPPSKLRLGRRAAEPRPHGLGCPSVHALEADQVGIAGAAAAHRRSEQAERLEAVRLIAAELHAGRSAVFGADQVA
jgi:hypothetical protein